MDYFDIENWEIIDKKICHFYDMNETAFTAICVKIGVLTSYKTTITGSKIVKTDIIRWISEKEYQRLLKNSGVIIF